MSVRITLTANNAAHAAGMLQLLSVGDGESVTTESIAELIYVMQQLDVDRLVNGLADTKAEREILVEFQSECSALAKRIEEAAKAIDQLEDDDA